MAAKRLLASENLDAHWLADRFALGAASVVVTPDDESSERDDRSAAWYAFHRRYSLSPKERLFIENIVERAAALTPKQRKWLHDIVDRLEAR
jgi:DNA-binding transcriptional LysR family regulator